MELQDIVQQIKGVVEELILEAALQPEQVLVIGCSTSEVIGQKIGTTGSEEVALAMFNAIKDVADQYGVFLAFQCCEHLNRAVVTEKNTAMKYGWNEVTVRPIAHAGGAMATAAYENFAEPIVVEKIQAKAGLDIGQTLIGMHLHHVAVPIRLKYRQIGEAVLTAAFTRPPLIGGVRACYPK